MLAWFKKNNYCKKTTILAIGLFLVVFLFLNITPALAQLDVPGSDTKTQDIYGLQQIDQTIALSGSDIRLIIARVIRAVLGLLGIIAIVLMIYAGYLIMTSGGNEEKIQMGKKTLINTTIGLAIILSSFAIVQFVINALTGGFLPPPSSDGISKFDINTYSGSGSLGKIIKDHYPTRDQIGVKRNISILVTFAEPIDPSSLILNSNNTCWGDNGSPTTTCDFEADAVPYLGDCLTGDEFVSYEASCDHLVTSSVQIFESKSEDKKLTESAAMTSYNAKGEAFTFTFKPFEPLGNDTDDIWYSVDLRPSIMKKYLQDKEKVSVFVDSFSGHYLWEFQTDTMFDFVPPHVVDVRPLHDEKKVDKNRVLQITFDEPMNPVAVQGILSNNGGFNNVLVNYIDPYSIDKDNPDGFIIETKLAEGEWRITNGYRTIEFLSNLPCGFNSCGQMIFCLPVSCTPHAPKCSNTYDVLIRTAKLLGVGESFQAEPLSGAMDLADNALDGNDDNIADDRPIPGKDGNFNLIGGLEKAPDNYAWGFEVWNNIDRSAPYIENVSPALDQGGVGGGVDVKINFSKIMTLSSLKEISLIEYPNDKKLFYPQGACFQVGEQKKCLDDLWFYVNSKNISNKTVSNVWHREFGPNDYDYYYYPVIPSSVIDENQNCLYPGYGPDTEEAGFAPTCVIQYDDKGKIVSKTNCVEVKYKAKFDTGCIQTTKPPTIGDPTAKPPTIGDPTPKLQEDTAVCLDYLEEESL